MLAKSVAFSRNTPTAPAAACDATERIQRNGSICNSQARNPNSIRKRFAPSHTARTVLCYHTCNSFPGTLPILSLCLPLFAQFSRFLFREHTKTRTRSTCLTPPPVHLLDCPCKMLKNQYEESTCVLTIVAYPATPHPHAHILSHRKPQPSHSQPFSLHCLLDVFLIASAHGSIGASVHAFVNDCRSMALSCLSLLCPREQGIPREGTPLCHHGIDFAPPTIDLLKRQDRPLDSISHLAK